MQFSTESVRDLARLLNESGLHEITLQTQGENETPSRIVVRGAAPAARPQIQRPISGGATLQNLVNIEAQNAALSQIDSEISDSLAEIETESAPVLAFATATAVGLFQNVTPVLQVGDVVKKGQAIGIVSSLKIPNSVFAPASGRIVEFLVEEHQGVEYGQNLLTLEVEEIA